MGSSQEKKPYNDSSIPTSYNLTWMQSIPDSTKLSSMTIPGTHNSCALHGICYARTQSWSLPEQMKAGIRYFDIRLRLYNNTLHAFHAFVNQEDTFNVILSYAINFLTQYPSECIIMQLVKEHTDKNCTKKMPELYEEYIKNIKNKIIEFNSKDITMGEIRGKILIIKIFGRSTSYMPGFVIQNKWSINTRFSLNNKKRKIKENFHRALAFNNKYSSDISNSKIFLNYLSASSDYAMMTPYTAAKKCNKLALRYKGRLGIILVDYPGEDLIKHLIEQNNFYDENKKYIIKEGDTIYIIHNDTQKYLYLNEENIENKFYCIKEPFGLSIVHKNKDIGRDYFMENDEIYLIGKNNYKYEFKICDINDDNDKIIYDKSLFRLQVLENNVMKYLENRYENKNSKNQYLFRITDNPDNFESFFSIKKIFI